MKKILIIVTLLFSFSFFAQKVEIYTYKNGIREITPTVVIEDNKVYTTKNGVRDVIPTLVVEENKVYKINQSSGVKEITPIIEIKPPTTDVEVKE